MRGHFGKPQIDFEKLAAELAEGKRIYRTYWYDCLPHMPENPKGTDYERLQEQQQLFDHLESIPGWMVRRGELRPRETAIRKVARQNENTKSDASRITFRECGRGEKPDGYFVRYEQKGVDVALALDLWILCYTRTIDSIILITGDADFVRPVEHSKEAFGLETTLWCHESGSKELEQKAHRLRLIDQALVDKVRKPSAV